MNKKTTLFLTGLFFAASLAAQVKTFNLTISGGAFMGTPIPDYTKWYYFSFEKGDTVGASDAVLEEVNPGSNIGAEVINTEWKARSDWDIAFHAGDVRTNGGSSGNGAAGSLKIAEDSLTSDALAEIFDNLTEAPADSAYAADTLLAGSFIFGMTSMPPLRTAQLSASAAVNGWATVGMSENRETPTVAIFKTTGGDYVKVYLKRFFDADGQPGFLNFDYAFIPLADGNAGVPVKETDGFAVSLDPVSGSLTVDLPAGTQTADVAIYSFTGLPVKQITAQGSRTVVSLSGLAKGVYVVKVASAKFCQARKIVI
jgi:hypothetical protein